MKPDALIRIRFLTPAEGGRASAIDTDRYGCPVIVNDHGFDCRFVLETPTRFELGHSYDIPVKFLSPELALDEIGEGLSVSLWEGKTIGTGHVLKVYDTETMN